MGVFSKGTVFPGADDYLLILNRRDDDVLVRDDDVLVRDDDVLVRDDDVKHDVKCRQACVSRCMSVFLDGEAAYCEDGGESIWQLNCCHRYMCWNGREQISTR